MANTTHQTRLSDSPYIHSVSHIFHNADNLGTAMPDGCWDLVLLKQKDKITIFRTGMLTRAIPLEREAGDELLTVSMKAALFMPHLPAQHLVDKAFDFPMFGKGKFFIDGSTIELPNFENVEVFIEKLLRMGILSQDKEVASALDGNPQATSLRTLQRHFFFTTGVTQRSLQQIARAQQAVSLIQQGRPLHWAAAEAGYFDQAQMTRFLKQIMGQTPGEIRSKGANTTKDLSLL